ncbi:eukaryotic initiation factor 4A [Trichinella spiralis]|uniref:eukaryotic initiation factor 4A n=1 Tax=Trichinella spiralis TaxID=6334 RepID=UPI0001EFC74C|nr:eukaryotic initiation factor 4A [Trichinella spiralis]
MFYFNRQWRRPHVRTPLMVDVLVRVSPVPRRACNGRGTFANNGATALRLSSGRFTKAHTEQQKSYANNNRMHGNFCLFFIILSVVDLLACAHSYAEQYQIANIFGTDAPKCKGLSALLREHGPEKPNASSQ